MKDVFGEGLMPVQGEQKSEPAISTQCLQKEEIHRKICPLFFIIDNSGSMACMDGEPIRKLNMAMEGLIQQLIKINQTSDYEFKIGIMTFNSFVEWHTDRLVSPNSIKWKDMYAEGATAWGKALTSLDHALSRFGLLTESVGYTRPIIIFTTDGFPTDEVEGPIERILQNKWYKISTKVAIAIDVVGLDSFLERITGEKDTVYFFYKAQPFEEFLKNMCLSLVSTVGLMIGSKQPYLVSDCHRLHGYGTPETVHFSIGENNTTNEENSILKRISSYENSTEWDNW